MTIVKHLSLGLVFVLLAGTTGCKKSSKSTTTTTASDSGTAVDTTSPTISNVTASTANGTYKAGDSVTVQVVFSESVTVTGTPTLTLETGTTDRNATYTSGSGSDTLLFTYTVQSGDQSVDLDYTSTSALALAGGTIQDASSNNATLTLATPGTTGSLGTNKAIVIDAVAPVISNVTSPNPNGTYGLGSTISVQIVFSEAVNVTGTPTLTLETGTTDRNATYTSGSGTNTLTFTYTVQSGDTASDLNYVNSTSLGVSGAVIADAVGNNATITLPSTGGAGSLGANKAIVIDAVAPIIYSLTATNPNGTYGVGTTINIEFSFSEAVTVTGTPTLTLETGTTDRNATYTSGSGSNTLVFTYTVQSGDAANDLDYVSTTSLGVTGATIADSAGNNATLTLPAPGSGNSIGGSKAIVIDGTAGTVTNVTSSSSNGTYGSGNTLSIQIVFSKAMTVTGTPRLALNSGASAYANYSSGSGTTTLTFSYTVASGDASSDLDYTSTSALALNGGTVRDSAGNNATLTLATPGAATSLGNNKAIVISTTTVVSSVTSSATNGSYTPGQSVVIAVIFNATVYVAGGTPTLTLETGLVDRTVSYSSGSGTNTLYFNYTVQEGDRSTDLSYVGTSSLSTGGGTIKNAGNVSATLTLPTPGLSGSLSFNKNLSIEGILPKMVTGVAFTCRMGVTGQVKCWGENALGQLGKGNTTDLGGNSGEISSLSAINLGTGRTAFTIAAGNSHVCAILNDGSVKCWGNNSSGQLGLDSAAAAMGDGGGEMGDSLATVNLGASRTAIAISAGSEHTCAILDNETLKCWGNNSVGQLGQDSTTTYGASAGSMSTLSPVSLGVGRTVRQVVAFGDSTCAFLDNSVVKCWGENASGQLGIGSTAYKGATPGSMATLTGIDFGSRTVAQLAGHSSTVCARFTNGQVACWGDVLNGQAGLETSGTYIGDTAGEMGSSLQSAHLTGYTATAITVGQSHVCALFDDTSARCWGDGSNGQLGTESTDSLGVTTNDMSGPSISLGSGLNATAISAGGFHTCALLNDYSLKCWGNNDIGQLGLEDTDTRGHTSGTMGDNLPNVNVF